eukprot:TRINITY_DN24738_c0_g1_i1.p1 TRINITY_DN24738_c0_g1~~TRINITY_DN24738_c0_g1_i1.p1  ORF type:complete len:750 (+),score=220.75 TRINITY_DN24738_c0_g1_i1:87-2336(+)
MEPTNNDPAGSGMMDPAVFAEACGVAMGVYCEDGVGSDELIDACFHMAVKFCEGRAFALGGVERGPTQVVYLDLAKLDDDLVCHLTGRFGNAPERYLSLAHVTLHCLVNQHLPRPHKITVRLRGVKVSKVTGQLRAHDVSSVISVRGTVVRLSSVQPLTTKLAYSCSKCGDVQVVPTVDGVSAPPPQCPRGKCRAAKKFGMPFHAEPLHPGTATVNHQRLKLQIESSSVGRVPCSVEVELRDSLCNQASPGDTVTCTGILKQDPAGARRRGPAPDRTGLTAAYLECNNIERSNEQRPGAAVLTEKNIDGIKAIASRSDVFNLLVHSLCPSILGHNLVKAGMLLTLFGGTPRDPASGQRGDMHMLVVGDPGAGKSQMLRAASHVSPRGVMVSGNSASASGLTVTLVRDVATGDSALEAGALVLGDLGTTCIDEFDKMEKTEHQALLEAMEQQRISIAKAGAVGSLPARTSVLAAANPTSGHYDDLKSVAENLRINPALLSRFDLVFILKDSIAGQQQEGLTRHVISLHSGGDVHPSAAVPEVLLTCSADGLEAHLNAAKYPPSALIPHALMTKYISYAKRAARPQMSREASDVLLEYYLQLRKAGDSKDAMIITTRQLESLIRLAQARAKVEFRSIVTAEDATEVIELMKRSLYQMCTDVETGKVDSNRGPGGAGRSKDGRALVTWMRDEVKLNRREADKPFTHRELVDKLKQWAYTEAKAERTVSHLNAMGDILSTGANGYRVKTVSVV